MGLRRNRKVEGAIETKSPAEEGETTKPPVVPMRRGRQQKKTEEKVEEPGSFFNVGSGIAIDTFDAGEEEADGAFIPEGFNNGQSSTEQQGLFVFQEEERVVDLTQDAVDLEELEEEPAEEPVKDEPDPDPDYWTKRTPHNVMQAIKVAATVLSSAANVTASDEIKIQSEDRQEVTVNEDGSFDLPNVRVYDCELQLGWDPNLEVKLQGNQRVTIDTGISVSIPKGYGLKIIGCTDLSTKFGLVCVNEGRMYTSDDFGTNIIVEIESICDVAYVPRYRSILRARLQNI